MKKYITIGTIPHYVKQNKNNAKVVYTKGTIMTRNNFTEAVTQKQSSKKMPQRYTTHPQKTTHADAQIQRKPGGNNTEITDLHRRSPQSRRLTFRAPSIGTPRGKCL